MDGYLHEQHALSTVAAPARLALPGREPTLGDTLPAQGSALLAYVLDCLALQYGTGSVAGVMLVRQWDRIQAVRRNEAGAWLFGLMLQMARQAPNLPCIPAAALPQEVDDVRKICLLVALGAYTLDDAAILLSLPLGAARRRIASAMQAAAC